MKSFLDLKQNKILLDNKSWEPLDTMVNCIEQDFGYA